MTTLLYSGQVLAKDPVVDWFAPEQYEQRPEHPLAKAIDDHSVAVIASNAQESSVSQDGAQM